MIQGEEIHLKQGQRRSTLRSAQKINLIEMVTFTTPAVIAVSIMVYIPFLLSIIYSLTEWNGISSKVKYIGFANFVRALTKDLDFINSVGFTLKYSIAFIILSNTFGLLVAVILARKFRFVGLFRSVFFIPYVMSMAVVSYIWKFMFTQGFSKLYDILGLELLNYSWLGSTNLVYYAVVIVGVWYELGFFVVLYIAGLKSIPIDVLEASEIDGAGVIRRFFGVKLPLIMPSITTCVLMSIINSLNVFDVVMAMTRGGPGNSSMSFTYNIYIEAFQNFRYGYASAKAVLYFILVMILTRVVLNVFKKKEVDI